VVSRIGTGFSDEDLANLTESLKDFQLNERPANYRLSKTLKPDVWFTPSQVNSFLLKILKFWRYGKLNVIN